MLSDADMVKLAELGSTPFDREFLAAMIKHHEGANVIADMIISSQNAEVSAFGPGG